MYVTNCTQFKYDFNSTINLIDWAFGGALQTTRKQ